LRNFSLSFRGNGFSAVARLSNWQYSPSATTPPNLSSVDAPLVSKAETGGMAQIVAWPDYPGIVPAPLAVFDPYATIAIGFEVSNAAIIGERNFCLNTIFGPLFWLCGLRRCGNKSCQSSTKDGNACFHGASYVVSKLNAE
jgi:hypothetical protein